MPPLAATGRSVGLDRGVRVLEPIEEVLDVLAAEQRGAMTANRLAEVRRHHRACIDDGLLDVLVVRQISPTALLAAARELQQLPPDGEYISYWQTPWLEVHPEEAIPVNLDGEPLHFSTVRYEAVPKAISLIVPTNCPLLSQRPKLKA